MRHLGWLWLAACGTASDVLVPFYSDDPLWTEPDLTDAVDLGHEASLLASGDQAAPGPITFEDATVASGLGAAVGGGNQHGVGLGLLDLDGDGAPDLVVINGTSNRTDAVTPSALFWNDGTGQFADGTASSGLGAVLEGLDGFSVAAGDVDRDGDIDLYVGAQPANVLLLNQGDRTFVDGTAMANASAGLSDARGVGAGVGKVVSVADVDGDGWLDLFSASSTHSRPGAVLLRNRGDGTFEDVSDVWGVRTNPIGNPCAVMFTDYDNDADADLWIWNDRGGHVLLRNEGATFADLGGRADRVDIFNPMGIDAADVDHDGDLDYYISNIGRHPLLLNQGDGRFVDASDAAGTRGDYGWGLAFEDFDANGWADLFVAQEDDRPVLVYQNLGNEPGDLPRYDTIEVPRPIPVTNSGAAHNVAAAFGDVDRDGRTDAVWATTDGSRLVLHRNTTDVGTHGTLEVRVAADAVGARVAVATPDGLVQFRDLVGGSSRASVNDLSVRFGLGHADGASWVSVQWPDGRTQTVTGVPAGVVTMGAP